MAKQIKFSHEDEKGKVREYTLEFTRKSVQQAEASGFNINELFDKPMTHLPALFFWAFRAHHQWMRREQSDAIFDQISNRSDLLAKLAEMYNEPLQELIGSAEEQEVDETKNVQWEATGF